MAFRKFILCASAAGAALGMASASAQEADLTVVPEITSDYSPEMTPWGEPDFRGTWPIDHLNGTPLQRPQEMGERVFLTEEEYAQRSGRIEAAAARYENEDSSDTMGMGHWAEMGEPNRRTSLLVAPADGQLPEMTEEGQRRSDLMRSSWRTGQTFDWADDFDTWDRCITRGLPASMFPFQYNNGMRIFQSPGTVAIQMEMIHETRIIPTDGKASVPSQIRNWMGESRGHWENGHTLVVETTNMKPGPSATNIGTTGSPPWNNSPISEEAKVVETFTMTGPDSIIYEVTYTDPVVFTEPWTARLDWVRDEEYGIFEYACHEGNVQIRNYITASRAQREQAAMESDETGG